MSTSPGAESRRLHQYKEFLFFTIRITRVGSIILYPGYMARTLSSPCESGEAVWEVLAGWGLWIVVAAPDVNEGDQVSREGE